MELSLTTTSVRFDELDGLRNINLTVSAGECVVLCGKSGCGKTTITRLLNGLIPELFDGEMSGRVLIGNMDTQDTPIYELSAIIGSVFQNPKTQFFTIDVRSELAFACENSGLPKSEITRRLKEVVILFEIEHLLQREMFDLSGGEKQLVAFAAAYMIQPTILVLDEPSSNLDFHAIETIKRILLKLKALGCTLVIAEHRLYYLQTIADRFIVLENGRLTADYATADFLALSTKTREALGLRALDLTNSSPATQQARRHSNKTLNIHNLTVYYPGSKNAALTVSDLIVTAGEVIGIIGHNGAGKTTLAKSLTGLLKKKTGRIELNGQTLNQRQQLNASYLVMQDVNYQLFCETVRKELLLKAGKPELFEEVLTIFELSELLERHPLSLSGGQKQRVAIATAVLSGKQLIILDEPTSGLDLYHMAQVSQILRYLQEQGVFVFVISHDVEFVQQTCTQLLPLHNGLTDQLLNLNEQSQDVYQLFQETIAPTQSS